ncbi:MAG: DUF362 domain-containing protein [Bacteroidetes bacterium]|nr:DUF362 domain-containing protein [Bacteroidota bacterium]
MKQKNLSRRSFIKAGAMITAGTIISTSLKPWFLFGNSARPFPDISVAKGSDYYNATIKAIEGIGGISRFVNRNARIALLISPDWEKPGTYTSPDVALAVVRLCFDAGAREVICLKGPPDDYWSRSSRFKENADIIRLIKTGTRSGQVAIPKGIKLKNVEIVPEMTQCDVFINIPISKNHKGTHFTGNLKNMMGACPYSTNKFFHKGPGGYADIPHLSQCIADLNLVRSPHLCIVDTTEVIITNGPAGPGEIIKPQTVSAGTDPVAMDAFTAKLIGIDPNNILMIKMAQDHGIGSMNLSNLNIRQIEI